MSSTLLSLYLGTMLVGRCDVNCWAGDDTRCECVCTGLNHGVGLDKAVEQTRRMVAEWVEVQRQQGIIFDGVEFGIHVIHEPLFALADLHRDHGEQGERPERRALAS